MIWVFSNGFGFGTFKGRCVKALNDGSFIFGGGIDTSTVTAPGNFDQYIYKVNSDGEILWDKIIHKESYLKRNIVMSIDANDSDELFITSHLDTLIPGVGIDYGVVSVSKIKFRWRNTLGKIFLVMRIKIFPWI